MPLCESQWPNGLESQGQCLPCSIPAVRIPRCIFGANLVILVQIRKKLLHGQAKIPIILSQNSQNDLEGQGQWPPFSIPDESIPECMFGATFVILVQINDELSCGRAEFPRIIDKMAKMTFKVKDLHFQYQLRVLQDACLVQIWWF